jgi:FtsP/CotA-like multicopper oxidase with cupredoxin domain
LLYSSDSDIADHLQHLHGYDFQVLAEGFGVWDGTITNPENPSRRDVHVLNKAQQTASDIIPAYAVIQFFTDNAGIWPLHCHLAWHNSGGLFTNLMIRPKDIQKFSIPDTISQTCMDWNNYASVAYPVLIDSGA